MTVRIPTRALGLQASNSTALHDSASRAVMYGNHISQAIVFDHPTERIVQTGVEKRLGEYTFHVKMPSNGLVIDVVSRFHRDRNGIQTDESPSRIVIFENRESREIDYIEIPSYCSNHQSFGFKYAYKDPMNMLTPGAKIPKDTIFADSPNVGPRGEYMNGRVMNVAFMSPSSVAEDGIEICEDVLDWFTYTLIEKRTVNFGASAFALNIFGTRENFKSFPDVGEYIRDDGLLMMLRRYNPALAPALMSAEDVREPDYYMDEGIYVRAGKGKVIDIQVVKSNNQSKIMSEAMCAQLEKYASSYRSFYKEILDVRSKIMKERKHLIRDGRLKMSPKMHRLILRAMAIADPNSCGLHQPLQLLDRKEPIDEYKVTFTIEYKVAPTMGGKLTDSHGG